MMHKRLLSFLLCLMVFCGVVSAQVKSEPRINLRLLTDEPEAVLAILAKRKAAQEVTEADWQRVFQSEGYVRLKKRETSMQRKFEEADFKEFVLSDQLLQRMPALEETLTRWKNADPARAGRLALAYLPQDAHIQAKIYPVIKPRDNSFVFDIDNDPAIFLYLDPAVTREKFENNLAHELHHIGYGTACPRKDIADKISKLPKNQQTLLTWVGAFGEGFAMLAAAGGPDVHPHAVSRKEDRARWDTDVANFNQDLKKVEAFFVEVLQGNLTAEQTREKGFAFFGTQGPWYTVGWRMATLIEKIYGRARLIECMCDQRLLLSTYNRAAKQLNRKLKTPLVLWSNTVIAATKG